MDIDNLTLKDIEIMVRILERWLTTSRRVEAILSRYAKQQQYYTGGRLSVDYVIDKVLERQENRVNMQQFNDLDDIDDLTAKKVLEKIRGLNKESTT